ncbi:MAG TPA: hypothetical protein VNF74_11530 [Terriglobales bacterium]|nr:hypothetical protein [Terriglobales bacterium]
MRFRTLLPFACLALLATAWAAAPNFAGTWVLNPSKCRNLGMMAGMADTLTIEQTPSALVLRDAAVFNGSKMASTTRFDLNGKDVPNRTPTGDPAQTASRWKGAELDTVWTIAGSIQGSTHRRLERRYLSADGRTLTEVSQTSASDPKPIVMVFDRR